jgi:hypothetical protein
LLAVYLWALAPEITLEDAGGLAPAAMYPGVPYPPGYPAWAMYSWVFAKVLPFGNIAWRIGVGSAVAAATMCGLVSLMVSRGSTEYLQLSEAVRRGYALSADQGFDGWNNGGFMGAARMRTVCGCVAGMGLGFSAPIWRMALVVDIWSLADLLFAIVVFMMTQWLAAPEKRRYLYAAIWVYGVSLTGDEEFVVMAPALLLWVFLADQKLGRDLYLAALMLFVVSWRTGGSFAVAPWALIFAVNNYPLAFAFLLLLLPTAFALIPRPRTGSEWRGVCAASLCLAVGRAVSFYLPVAGMSTPPMDWCYPRTVEGFFHLVSRGQYDLVHTTGDFSLFLKQLGWQARQSGIEFGWLYLLMATVAVSYGWQAPKLARRWLLGLLGMFVCSGPLMVATLNMGPDRQSMELAQRYYGAMDVTLAILAGIGAAILARKATPTATALARPDAAIGFGTDIPAERRPRDGSESIT